MSSLHRIRWKGRTTGPYSRDEIRAKLAAGEFSLLHRVEVSDRWIGLDEFLGGGRAVDSAAHARAHVATDAPVPAPHLTVHAPIRRPGGPAFTHGNRQANLGYFLCGLCFVLPLFATVAAGVFAWNTRRIGDRRQSDTLFLLAGLFTVLGLAFWLAVMFAWSRGMI